MLGPAGNAVSLSSSPVVPHPCGPMDALVVSTAGHCPLLAYDRYLDEPDRHIQTLDLGTGVTNNVGNPAVIVQVPNDGPETVSSDYPAFSPSGAWIAYGSTAPDPLGYQHIWLVRTNGTLNHRLTTSTPPGGELYPVFSPDAKYVFYTAQGSRVGEGRNIWRVKIDTHQREQITHFPLAMSVSELDRGGDKLAFVMSGTTSPVYTMSLTGTHLTAVPNTAGGQSPHLERRRKCAHLLHALRHAGHQDGAHRRHASHQRDPGQELHSAELVARRQAHRLRRRQSEPLRDEVERHWRSRGRTLRRRPRPCLAAVGATASARRARTS